LVRRARWLWLMALLFPAADAAAQPTTGPIPRFVVDTRGSLARFKQDTGVASSLQVDSTNLPTFGLGATLGAHVNVLRTRWITIGLGGEMVFARDSATADVEDDATPGPTVTTRLSGFAPQISFNFGRDEGWSYFSGGLGSARMTSEREDVPVTGTASRTKMLNYGGGARFFNTPHLAFTFDIRFYSISPRESTATVPGYPRAKFMVLSAGVAFK
jgi:Outer membrane protein beta-barrel domain